jgi:hypothetical protein
MAFFNGWPVNDVLAVGAASRAQTGFGFIGRCLDKHPQGTLRAESISAPYSRQIDVLISYNFELLIDAGIFASFPLLDEKELLKKVRGGRHSLDREWEKVSSPQVKSLFEIKYFLSKRNGEFKYYEVALNNGEVLIIEDHIDIRFDIKDFRDQMPNKLRLMSSKGDSMDSAVKFSSFTSKKIIDYLYTKNKKGKPAT